GSYDYYSYGNLKQAYDHLFGLYTQYKPFASGDYFNDTRELSAFLANIGQETNGNYASGFDDSNQLKTAGALGNTYGLYAVTEGSCATSGCADYGTKSKYCAGYYNQNNVWVDGSHITVCKNTSNSSEFCKLSTAYCNNNVWPDNNSTGPKGQFFGRGGKQLTYSFNYMYYGSKIFPDDKFKLGDNPSMLDSNGTLGWETALAYWSMPYEDAYSTKPSMREGFFSPTTTSKTEFDASTGFGKTVNLINGGVECGKTRAKHDYVANTTLNRINNYIELLFLNFGQIPIDRVEVTRVIDGQTVVDTYTKAQLLHNISTEGVSIKGYSFSVDASKSDAPHLVKYYTRDGKEISVDYKQANLNIGTYTMQWGSNGRYNSQPLIQEYYAPNANITKIMLYYDASSEYNKQKLSSERLDCTNVQNFEGN
ncbi:MAG: hypothetical protein RL154_678, partial [Pseudomonadota bacterium]